MSNYPSAVKKKCRGSCNGFRRTDVPTYVCITYLTRKHSHRVQNKSTNLRQFDWPKINFKIPKNRRAIDYDVILTMTS